MNRISFELDRKQKIDSLRSFLETRASLCFSEHRVRSDNCTNALFVPRESLNRWFFSGCDKSLAQELIDDFPSKTGVWFPNEIQSDRVQEMIRSYIGDLNFWKKNSKWGHLKLSHVTHSTVNVPQFFLLFTHKQATHTPT